MRKNLYFRKFFAFLQIMFTFHVRLTIDFLIFVTFQIETEQMNDHTRGWIRSSNWDLFWFHSGIWLTFLLLILESTYLQELFYATALFIFWISHRFSSFYLAWGTKAYKPLHKFQRIRFVIIPLFIIFGVLAVLYTPESISAFTFSERILGLLLVDFVWGTHHFAAQHYGILRLYQPHLNSEKANSVKKQDRIFCWGVGGVLVIIAEFLHGTSFLQEKNLLPNMLLDFGAGEITLLLHLGTVIVVVSTIFVILNSRLEESSFPRMLYLSGIGMMAVAAFQLDPVQFLMLWTMQHWLAALGLASHMVGNDLKQYAKLESVSMKKTSEKNLWKPWPVLISLCTFSIVMTPFFEIEAATAGSRYSEHIWASLMEWLQNSDLKTLLVGLGMATGFLHYWMVDN